jgi:hypothetical protein
MEAYTDYGLATNSLFPSAESIDANGSIHEVFQKLCKAVRVAKREPLPALPSAPRQSNPAVEEKVEEAEEEEKVKTAGLVFHNQEEEEEEEDDDVVMEDNNSPDNQNPVQTEAVGESETQTRFRELITLGIEVMKHGRSGNPHRRRVFCNLELTNVFWLNYKVKDNKKTPPDKQLLLEDVDQVARGVVTDVMKRSGSKEKPHLYLSLITKTRTLDMEFSSQEERDLIADGFTELIDQHKRVA